MRILLLCLSLFGTFISPGAQGWEPVVEKTEKPNFNLSWKISYEAYASPRNSKLILFKKSILRESPKVSGAFAKVWGEKQNVARADAMDGKVLPASFFEEGRTFLTSETATSRFQRVQYETTTLNDTEENISSLGVLFPEPLFFSVFQDCFSVGDHLLLPQGGHIELTVEVQDPKDLLDLDVMAKDAGEAVKRGRAERSSLVRVFKSQKLLRANFNYVAPINITSCPVDEAIRNELAWAFSKLAVVLAPKLRKDLTASKFRLATTKDLLLMNDPGLEARVEGQTKFSSKPKDWQTETFREGEVLKFQADWKKTHKNWWSLMAKFPSMAVSTNADLEAYEAGQSFIDSLGFHFYHALLATEKTYAREQPNSPFRKRWQSKMPLYRMTKPMLMLSPLLNPEIWMGPLQHGFVHAGLLRFSESWQEVAFLLFLELAHSVLGHGPLGHAEHDSTSFLSLEKIPKIFPIEDSAFLQLSDWHEANAPTNPEFRRGILGTSFTEVEERAALSLVSLAFHSLGENFTIENPRKPGPYLKLLERIGDFYFTPDLSPDQSYKKFAGRGFFLKHPHLKKALTQATDFFDVGGRSQMKPSSEMLTAKDFNSAFPTMKNLLQSHSSQMHAWLTPLLALAPEWRKALVDENSEEGFWVPSNNAAKLFKQLMESFENAHEKSDAHPDTQSQEAHSLFSTLLQRAQGLPLPESEKRIFVGWMIQRLLWRSSQVDNFWDDTATADGVLHEKFHDLTQSKSLIEQSMLLRTLQKQPDPQLCVSKLRGLMSAGSADATLSGSFLRPFLVECLILNGEISEIFELAKSQDGAAMKNIYEYFLFSLIKLRFSPGADREVENGLNAWGARPYTQALRMLSLVQGPESLENKRAKFKERTKSQFSPFYSAQERGALLFVRSWCELTLGLTTRSPKTILREAERLWFLAQFPERVLPLRSKLNLR